MHPFRRLKLWANDVALTRINAITDYFIATILEPALNPIDVRNKIDAAVERMVNSSSAADYLKNMTTREQHAMIQEAMNVRCKELLVHAEHVGLHIINEPDLQRRAEQAASDAAARIARDHIHSLLERISEEMK